MRFLALITDYDGTLAHHGVVAPETNEALERLKRSGRKLVMVTGRILPDLERVYDRLDLFDRVVAENGAVIHDPETKQTRALGTGPPDEFVDGLRSRGVAPLDVGEVIVATREPNESAVLEEIKERGLELQVIFNKGAVMVLPAGVNKAAGMTAALNDLCLSAHNAVGVGDAENDHAFLSATELAVAVANALPSLKQLCDHVTDGDHGSGVRELIDQMIEDDLASLAADVTRHDLILGQTPEGDEVRMSPFAPPMLVAGPSGSGKSTLVTGLLERLDESGYQFVVVDPEGDYAGLDKAVTLGDPDAAPNLDEAAQVLLNQDDDVVLNLLGVPLHDRPSFFQKLLPKLLEVRSRTGRPHWIVVDEAHHLLPAGWEHAKETLPTELGGLLPVTVHPDRLSPAILEQVGTVVAVGRDPRETIGAAAKALGASAPKRLPKELDTGEAIVWTPKDDRQTVRFRIQQARAEHRRHIRKYAEGELGEDASFYFRGPDDRLNLRAQNLALFAQMARGIDEETWLHHLSRGDYSDWFRSAIKDDDLASEAEEAERRFADDAEKSREAILDAVERRYTAPA
ncbi:MAG: HAD-IIB family hydrolase [Actinomycetota bacterium]